MSNLFNNIPEELPDELFDSLIKTEAIHIERIVSRGHSSPRHGWYDQEQAEFVLLLSGEAKLEFANGVVVSMVPGDWLEIPAHRKHRVLWTDENVESVWLAVHFPSTPGEAG